MDFITLTFGFVLKLPCEGKLYLSSIGNHELVQLEALPPAVGCGVILKPLKKEGETNLILETSAGSVEKRIVIKREN